MKTPQLICLWNLHPYMVSLLRQTFPHRSFAILHLPQLLSELLWVDLCAVQISITENLSEVSDLEQLQTHLHLYQIKVCLHCRSSSRYHFRRAVLCLDKTQIDCWYWLGQDQESQWAIFWIVCSWTRNFLGHYIHQLKGKQLLRNLQNYQIIGYMNYLTMSFLGNSFSPSYRASTLIYLFNACPLILI